jgi:para-aminobenzoate synthetase/4-amino-4-deoxychorismate lyase
MLDDFCLLETMRVDPGVEIPLLERHLTRLQQSAVRLGFACNLDRIRELVRSEAFRQTNPIVLRLLLNRAGTAECLYRPVPASNPKGVRLAAQPVRSDDPLLANKTTARQVYEQARVGMPEELDALLYNERGEVTETTIANVAVHRHGQWITPPLPCGLLGGVKRQQLLDEGAIVEGVIRMQDLVPGETIRCFNAVRGVYDVPLVA